MVERGLKKNKKYWNWGKFNNFILAFLDTLVLKGIVVDFLVKCCLTKFFDFWSLLSPTWHWFMPKATDYFWHIERLPQLFAYFANFSVEGVSGEAKQQQLLLKFTTQKSSYLLHFNADRKEIHGVGCPYFLLSKMVLNI